MLWINRHRAFRRVGPREVGATVDTRHRSAFLQAGADYARLDRAFARDRPGGNEVIRAIEIIRFRQGAGDQPLGR